MAVGVVVLTTAEVLALLRSSNHRPLAGVVYGCGLLVVATAAAPLLFPQWPLDSPWDRLGLTLIAVMLTVALVAVGEMSRFRQPGSSTVHASLALWVVLYISLPMAFLIHLRLLHADRWGLLAVISVLVVVKMADTGAYFVGRRWGRRSLAPVLSPKKTIEGSIGALLAGCISSWLFFYLAGAPAGPAGATSGRGWAWLLYGAFLTVAGMLGDLSESLLKRDMQQKDSSRWLPGLGGVLDVVDSLLLAAPVAYVWWAIRGVGP